MHIRQSLLALERSIEKGLLGFFLLLGAGVAPENWQPALQETQNRPQTRHTGTHH